MVPEGEDPAGVPGVGEVDERPAEAEQDRRVQEQPLHELPVEQRADLHEQRLSDSEVVFLMKLRSSRGGNTD